MNNDEIARALRCNDAPDEADGMGCANKKCKYRDVDGACDIVSMCEDAADRIESQQIRISELEKQLSKSTKSRAELSETYNSLFDDAKQLQSQLASAERDIQLAAEGEICDICTHSGEDAGDKNSACWNCTRGNPKFEWRETLQKNIEEQTSLFGKESNDE